MFKQYQIVIVDIPENCKEYENSYDFKHGDRLLFLGEIPNMTDHFALVNKEGKIVWGYHIDFFREPTEDEV